MTLSVLQLSKVSERAMPPMQKEEDRGTSLEQIQLKGTNYQSLFPCFHHLKLLPLVAFIT